MLPPPALCTCWQRGKHVCTTSCKQLQLHLQCKLTTWPCLLAGPKTYKFPTSQAYSRGCYCCCGGSLACCIGEGSRSSTREILATTIPEDDEPLLVVILEIVGGVVIDRGLPGQQPDGQVDEAQPAVGVCRGVQVEEGAYYRCQTG